MRASFHRLRNLTFSGFHRSRNLSQFSMAKSVRNKKYDRDPDDFFRYTAARWLWNEPSQLARRYAPFDIDELIRVAGEALGSSTCTDIEKLPEGNFNKTFLLSFSDGKQAIARVPNPNAGRPFFSTASEVATMDFLRTVIGVPVPKILRWNCQASQSPVRAEYIIMEKMQGKELLHLWHTLDGKQKYEIVKQIVGIESRFLSARFTKFGSLYYTETLPELPSSPDPLYLDAHGVPQNSARFVVGPINSRGFFDFGRGEVDIDLGPWNTAEEFIMATANREIACIHKFKKFPQQKGIFGGPGQYKPTAEAKISTLENYLKVAKYILPKNKSIHDAVIWHGDLHTGNIFVDPDEPTKIVGIIDWQAAPLSPLFLQASHPSILDFEGPIPENFEIKPPENFNELSPEEQEENKKLRSAQTLYKLYDIASAKANEDVYNAIQAQDTLGPRISGLVGNLFSDGEPVVQSMLVAAEDKWPELLSLSGSANVECPLAFSNQERTKIEEDAQLWGEGVELMASLRDYIGVYSGWDGLVNHEEYEPIKERVREARERFIREMADREEDKEAWSGVFPYPVEN